MKELKQLSKINRRWLASVVFIIIVTVCAVIGVKIQINPHQYYDDSSTQLNDGWVSEEGEVLSLSDLPSKALVLEHSAEGMDLKNKRLCMKSVDTFFEVIADGELIYSYYPQQPAFLGESYGMYIHAIPVPENASSFTLKLTPIYEGSPPAVLNTIIEDPGKYMIDLFKDGIPGFCICLLMMILGLIMVVTGIFTSYRKNHQQIEFFTLGFFAVFVAVWSVNDTLLLQILTQNPAIIRLLNYLTLIFLPYFIVSFIAGATGHKKSILLFLLFTIICGNFVLNVTLTSMKISDYFHLVKVSQAVIIIAICMAAYFVISAVRKDQVEKRFLNTFILGIISITVGAGIDLIRFRISSNVLQVTSLYARMGSLLFLVLIGLYLINESNRIQLENSHALAHLAYTDGLTGMKNRLAFSEAEASLAKDPDAGGVIIQFDINNLKMVNDLYGHAEGDRHIIGAANIILDSVKDAGSCYRTGGDEFIAIITGSVDESIAHNAVKQMETMIQEYNTREKPPVQLDIAYGIASFSVDGDSLEKAEQLADKRMYECKHIKKLNEKS